MAKQGMRRYHVDQPYVEEGQQRSDTKKNEAGPVPEIQGKAKAGHEKATRIGGHNDER